MKTKKSLWTKKRKWIDIILRDIGKIFKNEEEENYCKPVRAINFWSNNYIEYESNGDRNKPLSIEKYVNKIRRYLKDIINYLKKFNTWKIQLTTANKFASSIDYDNKRVMYSKSDIIEIMMNDEPNAKVIQKMKWYKTFWITQR